MKNWSNHYTTREGICSIDARPHLSALGDRGPKSTINMWPEEVGFLGHVHDSRKHNVSAGWGKERAQWGSKSMGTEISSSILHYLACTMMNERTTIVRTMRSAASHLCFPACSWRTNQPRLRFIRNADSCFIHEMRRFLAIVEFDSIPSLPLHAE